MRLEGISENSKRIISAMRNLIDRGETKHLKEDLSGWQYGGETFIEMVASLEKGIKQELESQNIHVSNRSTYFESIIANQPSRRSSAALCDIFPREPILSHPILRSSYWSSQSTESRPLFAAANYQRNYQRIPFAILMTGRRFLGITLMLFLLHLKQTRMWMYSIVKMGSIEFV